jgi:hypothetical protein
MEKRKMSLTKDEAKYFYGIISEQRNKWKALLKLIKELGYSEKSKEVIAIKKVIEGNEELLECLHEAAYARSD